MKTRLRPTALLGAALSIGALAASNGCLYLSDAVHRDAQSVSRIPQAASEGAKVDLENYRVAKPGTPAGPSALEALEKPGQPETQPEKQPEKPKEPEGPH